MDRIKIKELERVSRLIFELADEPNAHAHACSQTSVTTVVCIFSHMAHAVASVSADAQSLR